MSNQIISGIELVERVGKLGCADVKFFRDARYFLPSRDWLVNRFAPFLRNKFWTYKRAYIKSRFDCDKFAHEAMLDAKIDAFLMANAAQFALEAATLCLKENEDIGDAGMAFLYTEVLILPGRVLNGVGAGKHAQNTVFHPDGSASAFDPQNGFWLDALEAYDPVQPHEDPNRPSRRRATFGFAWV